jgi:hypothetical protein
MTGVVIICVSKWYIVALMQVLQQQFAAQDAAIAAVEEDENASTTALQEVNQAFVSRGGLWLRLTWSGISGDIVFYGCFLVGLWQ